MKSKNSCKTQGHYLLAGSGLISCLLLAMPVTIARSVVQNDPVERVDPRTLLKSGKVFTIRLVATRTALEPPLMVMLPGQRVKVVFENQTGKATNLMFDFPQAAKFTFPENVPNGGE